MKEIFKIGNVSVYLFGVAVALGMLAGVYVMLKEAARKGLNKDKMMDMALYTMVGAIIGGRIYYIIAFNLDYYIQNPLEIIYINLGGLSIQGGLMGGALAAALVSRKNNISFWKAADAFAPGIALGQAIGRIGCDVYGVAMKTIYPWGVKIGMEVLHPAQMYEMFLDLILFTFLWTSRGKNKYNGQLFIKYIIGFSINRAAVEFFRSNPIVVGPFTIAHVTSLVIIIVAIVAGRIIRNKSEMTQIGRAYETEAVKVPVYEYMLIAVIAAAGMLIYYYIN